MIEISTLHQRDLAAVTALFNLATAALPYRWELASQEFRELALFDEAAPRAVLAVDAEGWLVARQDERTLGFAHCAMGRLNGDARTTRRGFLRHLLVHPQAPAGIGEALLAACERYFAGQEPDTVHAFHIRSGYPCYLAGRGMVSGAQFRVMTALGRAGYRISDRWLLYEKRFAAPLGERLPALPSLSLQIERTETGGFALYAAERARPAAELVVDPLSALSAASQMPSASLRWLKVEPAYRRKGIGRWLLQRAVNELAASGGRRLIVDINHEDAAAQSLLLHLGFEELPLSGYSYVRDGERRR